VQDGGTPLTIFKTNVGKDDLLEMQVYASLDLQIYALQHFCGYALSTIILINFGC
jgi:hypothetical protein